MVTWSEIQQAMTHGVLVAIQAGWDRRAVHKFVDDTYKKISGVSLEEALPMIQQNIYGLHLVGSPIYEKLFQRSTYTPSQKLALLFKQLGAELDEHGMLQLRGNHQLDAQMPPHAPFLQELAVVVQKAYPQGLVAAKNQEKAKMVHQLRMYLDRNNIYYIRTQFKYAGISDEEALRNYVYHRGPQGLGRKKLKRAPARLHNKYLKGSSYQQQRLNKKRLTPNFHSEFILDKSGAFISQWDILEERWTGEIISDPDYYLRKQPKNYEEKLMNGESFNYANRNDQQHDLLDGNPPGRFDHELRKQVKTKWLSPTPEMYDYKQDRKAKVDDYSK